ncbi:MAG: hypothetical protein E6G81_06750 [Alphaproteobacteria bacterium]|nr:MAG: hypothetical protein E6G81_06750 [Alphaproteobacteria bacterium]
MALSDWTELENLSGEIADSQSRLAAARSTQNHGLVKLLERQITEAEKWRDRLLSQITARMTSSSGPAARRRDPPAVAVDQPQPMEAEAPTVEAPTVEAPAVEAPAVEAAIEITPIVTSPEPAPVIDAASPEPAPIADRLEGVADVWDQLTRADVERVKRELGLRRAELLSRHADELRALDAQQTEIDTLEQTIDAFARRFNIAGAEVVVPFEGERNPRGQARG